MLKQIITLIVISALIVLFMSYAQLAVQWLAAAHEWVSQLLTDIFSGGYAGNLARSLIALLSIPLLIGLIPAAFYWVLRRHWFPYFMEVVWVVWFIQAGALLALYKAAA